MRRISEDVRSCSDRTITNLLPSGETSPEWPIRLVQAGSWKTGVGEPARIEDPSTSIGTDINIGFTPLLK
jgi:hypothetical protein